MAVSARCLLSFLVLRRSNTQTLRGQFDIGNLQIVGWNALSCSLGLDELGRYPSLLSFCVLVFCVVRLSKGFYHYFLLRFH